MTSPTSLDTVLTANELTIGTMLKSMSVNMAEALGYSTLDFLFLDRQHGSPVFHRIEHIVRAADLNDMPVAVRVPRDDTSMITNLLDIGVRGIVLPQVETAEQIEEAKSHIRYTDGRSLGTTTRAAKFGEFEQSEYIEYVNSGLALLPMIETKKGLQNIEELAAVEAVTALLIGPGDLAYSLETDFWSDRNLAAIDEICTTAASHGCSAGIFLSSQSQVEHLKEQISFTIYRKDVEIVTNHLESLQKEL